MTGNGVLLIALAFGIPLGLALFGKGAKWKPIGGLISRDAKGRMVLVLGGPAKKKRRKRR